MVDRVSRISRLLCAVGSLAVLLLGGGCHVVQPHDKPVSVDPVYLGMPKELDMVSLPQYRVEPPDILVIDALRISPRPPYALQTGDVVDVQVRGTLPDLPIAGPYALGVGGVVDFGFPYGSIRIAGMDVEQAKQAINEHLMEQLRDPVTTVTLLQIAASQQIAGEHLVAPDGMVTLGNYGRVYLAGQTLDEAKQTIEQHLSRWLENPEVALDVWAYNSKVYYVITEGAGTGDRVTRFPVTGNERVLDAIANVNGLTQISSKRIWIARPSPAGGEATILPVDWEAVSKRGITATNYQVLPGDRVFIAEDNLVAFDTHLAKLLTPIERIFGFSVLGASTVSRFSGNVLGGGAARGAGGGFGGF